jgi:GNAT superfamily N-acetyltransferase
MVRPLRASDCGIYRALRARVLTLGEGKYFTDHIKESRLTTEKQWHDWCTETHEHCIMGTFIEGELVGVMSITMYGPPESLTVEWESTWLDPRYRKFGLAKPAYEKVYQWTKDQGYKYAAVLIRHDSLRSREIREKHGAVYVCTKRGEKWDDGSAADLNLFVIDLYPAPVAQNKVYDHAIRSLESIIVSLQQEISVMNAAATTYALKK